MFYKGLLYVRIRNEIADELIYLEDDWNSTTHLRYESLLFRREDRGVQPTFNSDGFDDNPEGGIGIYGSRIKFVRATDSQIMSLLNFFNTIYSVKAWVHKMQTCKGLLDSEKKRLETLAMQSKYYND